MNVLPSFLFGNEYSLYFFYGFAFILTGFILALRVKSKYKIGNKIWLLAAFALVHGAAELLHSWIYLQNNYIYHYNTTIAFIIERVLLAGSFTFLFFFGIELVLFAKPQWGFMRAVPALLFISWFTYFIGWETLIKGIVDHENIYLSIVTARYFLGFPSALITAVGLYMQLRATKIPHLAKYVKGSAFSFGFYGLMTGVFVRPGNFFPANVINTENLYAFTAIPVEVFRMICAISITYFIMKTLQVIDDEVIRRLELAEITQAVFEERERISRDLHDGVLQSIFSVGLRLERCMLSHKEKMQLAEMQDVEFAIDRLNVVMHDIRQFISNLTVPLFSHDIQTISDNLKEEFNLYPEFNFQSFITGTPVCLDNNKLVDIYYFVKESLSNSRKHAFAKNVSLEFHFTKNHLRVIVKDDGIGFDPRNNNDQQGMGLKNMYERTKRLKGLLTFNTGPGCGTEIVLDLPV
ncbi:MAG: sensor histidine kinase [Bacillota bacterium]